MSKVYTHIALFTVILLSSMTSALAVTQQAAQPANTSQAAAAYVLSESGYIQHIQAKDVTTLLGELDSTYRECQDYRSELSAAIEDMQIDAGDIVISIILPGGILYYAQKKLRLMALESDLDSIDKALVDLETDIARLSGGRQLAKTEQE